MEIFSHNNLFLYSKKASVAVIIINMTAERGPVIMLALYTEKIPGTGIRYSDRLCNATYLPTYLPTDGAEQ
jgi:hypothetical protein